MNFDSSVILFLKNTLYLDYQKFDSNKFILVLIWHYYINPLIRYLIYTQVFCMIKFLHFIFYKNIIYESI